jgi:hypothetical protein
MKGLAIYTVVLYGLCLLSIFSEPTKEMWIGMAALCPVFIFAILYLVRGGKNDNKEASGKGSQAAEYQHV